MRKWTTVFLGLLILGAFSACENKSNQQQLDTVTSTDADRFIQDGQTTKGDILGFFGHDFTVELDGQNRERWIYTHLKYHPLARNFIPFNFFSQGYDVKHTQIIIVFDENDVVTKHYFHRYEDQIKMGL